MPKPAKILHHVGRLVNSLSITTATENDIDLLIKTISTTHKEYTLEPVRELRAAVAHALHTIIDAMNLKPQKVMSLNQMVRSSSLKRQRPAETEELIVDNDANDDQIIADAHYEVSQPSARHARTRDSIDGKMNIPQQRGTPAEKDISNKSDHNQTGDSIAMTSSGKKKIRGRSSTGKVEGMPSNATQGGKDDVEADIVNAIMGKRKPASSEFLQSRPFNRLSNMAGIDSITLQVKELVFYPVLYPTLYCYLGVQPPCGLLLHGPSGCGKTALAYAIAGELGLPFFKASGPELIGGTSGESEQRIRDIFLAAAAMAPSVLFIDALDVIAGKKDSASRGMDRRIVAQLFDSIDNINDLGEENLEPEGNSNSSQTEGVIGVDGVLTSSAPHTAPSAPKAIKIQTKKGLVVLIAATSKADLLDPGVRGRFSRELSLPVPDAPSRTKILKLMTSRMKLGHDVDLTELGRVTPGFVGADLKVLAREAGMLAVSRIVGSNPDSDTVESTKYINQLLNGGASDHMIDTERVVVEISATPDNSSSESDVVMGGDAASVGTKSGHGDSNADSNAAITDGSKSDTASSIHCQHLLESASAETPGEGQGQGEGQGPIRGPESSNEGVLPCISPEGIAVGMDDFLSAAKHVQPTAKREGFAVVPDVSWGDVGALAEVREELLHNVLEPIAHPERFRALGLEVPAGVLFFGPPGCGKTLLAKALANQSGANFISVKGPELLNMYVGESESRVRQVFSRARASAPCVIFFDELDALCPKRGSGAEGGSGVSERVVNQLLTELDGLETRKDVYIIAATNRLELIDDAMLRPGRLGKLLYVPLPDATDRIAILKALVRKVSLDGEGVDIVSIGGDPRTEGFSGADMAALVREAGLAVVRELMSNYPTGSNVPATGRVTGRGADHCPSSATATSSSEGTGSDTASSGDGSLALASTEKKQPPVCISARHFEAALQKVRPSVALHDRQRYERVHQNIKEGMGAIEALSAAAKKPPVR